MAKNINEIKEEIRDLICNNPNYFMIDKIEVLDKEPTVYFINEKRETYRTVDITLKPAFYFNVYQKNNKSFSLRFKDDKKNHLDAEWLSRDLNNALSEAYFKDYYLFYDPKKYLDMETVDANLDALADEFFNQSFGSLNNKERALVYQYANKVEYNSPLGMIGHFKAYFDKYGHLPYEHEDLAKRRIAATKHGYLTEKHNQVIDGILAIALIDFITKNNRWPRKNEAAYENLYLPVVEGYQKGLYCPVMMENLDYYHLLYRKVSIGEMIFDSMMASCSNYNNPSITKVNQRVRYYDFDYDEVKYHCHKCYKNAILYYDNELHKNVTKEYLIDFRGYESTTSAKNGIFNKIQKNNKVFDEYCETNDIPVLIINNEDLKNGTIQMKIVGENRKIKAEIDKQLELKLTQSFLF